MKAVRDLEWIRDRSVEVSFSGCWIWMNCLSNDGYAQIYLAPWSGHKAAYEAANDPVPEGFELHHICEVRCCVNPDHLVAVTHLENVQASDIIGVNNHNEKKTHCFRGHAFNEENTVIEITRTKRGYARKCRQCRRDGQKRRYHNARK